MNKFAVSDNVYARDDRLNERKVLKSLRTFWLGKCWTFSNVCKHFFLYVCGCLCIPLRHRQVSHKYYEDFHSLFCVNAYTRVSFFLYISMTVSYFILCFPIYLVIKNHLSFYNYLFNLKLIVQINVIKCFWNSNVFFFSKFLWMTGLFRLLEYILCRCEMYILNITLDTLYKYEMFWIKVSIHI